MAFLTLYEMLPQAFEYAGRKDAVKAVFVGMAFMSMRCVMLLLKGLRNIHTSQSCMYMRECNLINLINILILYISLVLQLVFSRC